MATKTFEFRVSVSPDEDMGMDDPEAVRRLIHDALCDSGMDNGASINVDFVATTHDRTAVSKR